MPHQLRGKRRAQRASEMLVSAESSRETRRRGDSMRSSDTREVTILGERREKSEVKNSIGTMGSADETARSKMSGSRSMPVETMSGPWVERGGGKTREGK